MTTNVLLIEDERDLRAEMAAYLLSHGHRVSVCGSLEEATELLENARDAAPDVILADLTLPDGDGATFYAANASAQAHTRWVLMSDDRETVRLSAMLGNRRDLPGCVVVEKTVPLYTLDRFIHMAARSAPAYAGAVQ